MRCLLIYPRFSEFSFWNFSYLARFMGRKYNTAPLGLMTVAALLPKSWDIKLVDMNTKNLDDELLDWADIVMTGGMITQQLETLKIIAQVHARGKPVVVGGPDASSQPEIYAEADFFVLDEAELTLPEFLKALEAGAKSGTFRSQEHKPDLTQSPIPRYDLIRFSDYLYIGVQTSRGCPYTCEFCDIIELYGRVPRNKTPNQVLSELNALYYAGHRGHVDFVDDNFIGSKKAAKELLRAVIDWSEEHGWPFFFSTEATITLAADAELLELFKRCDFRMLFVGIETPDPALLRQTQKKQNTLAPIAESIHRLNEAGMLVWGGFILGFDEEKAGAGEALVACVEETHIGAAMTGLLTSLPNTQLSRRLAREGRDQARGGAAAPGEIDQMTGGLNFTTRRPRLEILREYRQALSKLYSPGAYFARARGFLKWYRGHTHFQSDMGNLPMMAVAFLAMNLMYLMRPWLWKDYAWSMAAGLFHSPAGFAQAAGLAMMFLHFTRQTDHVLGRLDTQILALEKAA